MTNAGSGKYERLLERCKGLPPIVTAVAYPCEQTALDGAIDAAKQGLITPILVGPAATLREIAKTRGIDIDGIELVDVEGSRASAARAVQLVREGKAELLMKGSLHSDELLSAVIAKDAGLRTILTSRAGSVRSRIASCAVAALAAHARRRPQA